MVGHCVLVCGTLSLEDICAPPFLGGGDSHTLTGHLQLSSPRDVSKKPAKWPLETPSGAEKPMGPGVAWIWKHALDVAFFALHGIQKLAKPKPRSSCSFLSKIDGIARTA